MIWRGKNPLNTDMETDSMFVSVSHFRSSGFCSTGQNICFVPKTNKWRTQNKPVTWSEQIHKHWYWLNMSRTRVWSIWSSFTWGWGGRGGRGGQEPVKHQPPSRYMERDTERFWLAWVMITIMRYKYSWAYRVSRRDGDSWCWLLNW